VRERLFFIALLLAMVVAVPLAYWLLFERELAVGVITDNRPQAPANLKVRQSQPPVEMVPTALSIAELRGRVEIAGPGGKWSAAEVGAILEERDRIRTGNRGRALLIRPGSFSVELDATSEFRVKELTEEASRFLLQQGMMEARVLSNPARSFEVDAEQVSARTSAGTFRMSVNQQGLVTVGSQRGKIEVEAGGKIVEVQPGYFTRVVQGAKPRDPIKVPPKLFLRVKWPARRERSRRRLLVAGRTEFGSRVRINNAAVMVDSRGRFRQVIILKEGRNQVHIEAYDAGWRKTDKTSPPIIVDTRPDAFQIKTSPGMWEKRKP